MTTTTHLVCHHCGRPLRSAHSLALGYGPTCARRITAAAALVDLDAYQTDQVTRALELIAEHAIVGTRARHRFVAVSSHGDANYDVDADNDTCTCPAGERAVRCYHLAAASILAAA
jgi:hypothetical protein